MKYDLFRLSAVDFEELIHDLLEKELNLKLESFSVGKDNGIDLRYSSKKDKNDIIIQCKHIKNWHDLKSNLKKEILKVKPLNPDRYILATSTALSPLQKDQIINLFSPYIKNTSDVLGEGDISNMLDTNEEILHKNFKLWLSNAKILEKIIHSGIHAYSEMTKDNIEQKLRVYVKNKSFDEVLRILDEHNSCIISGKPGIGKSTLAEMIIYHYLNNDYKLVSLTKDINEGLKLLSHAEEKQIFYYDDFLGANFYNQFLEKNEERTIINFIKHIKKCNNKKILFTTREYILNQAKLRHEIFQLEDLSIFKIIVDLESYTKIQKGRILYHHIYFSNIRSEIKDELRKKENYLRIIDHNNYTPRIIDQILKEKSLQSVDACMEYILNNLENPKLIWDKAFNDNITESSRSLLYVLCGFKDAVKIERLQESWEIFYNEKTKKLNVSRKDNDFQDSLLELENCFINYLIYPGGSYVSFYDPSIRDYIIYKIRSDTTLQDSLTKSAVDFKQFQAYINIVPSEKNLYQALEWINEDYKKIQWLYSFNDTSINNILDKKIQDLCIHKKCDPILLQLIIENNISQINCVKINNDIYEYIKEDEYAGIDNFVTEINLKKYIAWQKVNKIDDCVLVLISNFKNNLIGAIEDQIYDFRTGNDFDYSNLELLKLIEKFDGSMEVESQYLEEKITHKQEQEYEPDYEDDRRYFDERHTSDINVESELDRIFSSDLD